MFSVSRAATRAVPRACRVGGAYMHTRAAGRVESAIERASERAAWHPRAPRASTSRSYSSAEASTTQGIAELADAGRWSLVAQGAALERSFRFKNFTKTWDFMTAVALQCKLKNHHPEWSNVYNTVFVRWTTHSADAGLTAKDVEMARICDGLGKAFGEVVEAKESPAAAASTSTSTSASAPTPTADDTSPTCKMTSLADTAKGITGGDCCNHTPEPKSS